MNKLEWASQHSTWLAFLSHISRFQFLFLIFQSDSGKSCLLFVIVVLWHFKINQRLISLFLNIFKVLEDTKQSSISQEIKDFKNSGLDYHVQQFLCYVSLSDLSWVAESGFILSHIFLFRWLDHNQSASIYSQADVLMTSVLNHSLSVRRNEDKLRPLYSGAEPN